MNWTSFLVGAGSSAFIILAAVTISSGQPAFYDDSIVIGVPALICAGSGVGLIIRRSVKTNLREGE